MLPNWQDKNRQYSLLESFEGTLCMRRFNNFIGGEWFPASEQFHWFGAISFILKINRRGEGTEEGDDTWDCMSVTRERIVGEIF